MFRTVIVREHGTFVGKRGECNSARWIGPKAPRSRTDRW